MLRIDCYFYTCRHFLLKKEKKIHMIFLKIAWVSYLYIMLNSETTIKKEVNYELQKT